MPIEFVGAFESTYMPLHDVDVAETTGHTARWRQDLALLGACGVTQTRYPVRWHRIETVPGVYDWGPTDEVMEHLGAEGFSPIVDLLHHTSYPRWLRQGFADPRFGPSYLRFLEAFARRYPWIPGYTLLNEPFTTLFFCGHEGIWPPHGRGLGSFLALCRNVLPPLASAMAMYRDLLPDARHVYVEPCGGHAPLVPGAQRHADLANDRQLFILDLVLGRPMDHDRPFVADVVAAQGQDVLDLDVRGRIDVLGLDYYAHLELSVDLDFAVGPAEKPVGLRALIQQYWDRYHVPLMLGETNIRGFATDRASWLKYTLEQCELAVADGIPLESYCWFPLVDSMDWDSLLTRADRHLDPVGIYWLDGRLERHASCLSEAYRLAALGASSSELPAFRFLPPVDGWLRGLLPQMQHWEWQDPLSDGGAVPPATPLALPTPTTRERPSTMEVPRARAS